MFTLNTLAYSPSSLEGECISVAHPEEKNWNGVEFSIEISALSGTLSYKYFDVLKFKIIYLFIYLFIYSFIYLFIYLFIYFVFCSVLSIII